MLKLNCFLNSSISLSLKTSHMYKSCFHDFTGEQLTPPTGGSSRNTVELSDTPGDHCYWEEIKGNGCKYYRNAVTNRYLGE